MQIRDIYYILISRKRWYGEGFRERKMRLGKDRFQGISILRYKLRTFIPAIKLFLFPWNTELQGSNDNFQTYDVIKTIKVRYMSHSIFDYLTKDILDKYRQIREIDKEC